MDQQSDIEKVEQQKEKEKEAAPVVKPAARPPLLRSGYVTTRVSKT